MGDYDFWTSGLNVKDQAGISQLLHFGWGAEATGKFYNKDLSGWFQLAIPTPTQIDNDDHVELRDAFIYIKREGNAEITRVDLWDGPNQIYIDQNRVRKINQQYGKQWIEIDLPDIEINFGIVISMLVKFPKTVGPKWENAKITFYGAGIRFNE
ncbi:MAG: hypothetical protein HZC47_08390 [Methanobacterium sp.]|uniref:hypothetical protein n=1 Tax=Methanobacterium sp. TaxID=2164 RepID=UPI003D64C1DC|nr:hypothetical protein [Methanobacterium sp.]